MYLFLIIAPYFVLFATIKCEIRLFFTWFTIAPTRRVLTVIIHGII